MGAGIMREVSCVPMNQSRDPLSVLQSRFGYERFRPLQAEIISNVLAGQDTLALMPTGGGKSLCYQLPALLFDGTTLVISPLIALMKDQVDALNATGNAAAFINSSLSGVAIQQVQEQVRQGQVQLLYVSPERLALPGFQRFLRGLRLSLIAIDEAHCISEWGHEFRPDYRNLRQLREDFPETPVIALTATATEIVRRDIVDQLDLHRGKVFLSGFNRENLRYTVLPKQGTTEQLLSLLERYRGQPAIIYCFSRQETEDVAGTVRANGHEVRAYHAGLDSETRRRAQEDFVRDRAPVIVATIAFGMGIDKPDVRLVVHYSLPKSVEGYYQETGRAGRDGLPSECVLFYSYGDKYRQDFFIRQIESPTERESAQQKMGKIVEYAQVPTCRRRFLLEYFGDEWPHENCGGCDVCLDPREDFDATEIAQKILSAVLRTGERFGAAYVIRVLLGSGDKRIAEMGHDSLSVYGIVKDFDRTALREIIGQLEAKGLLAQAGGDYPTLAVPPEGREFLRERAALTLSRPVESRRPPAKKPAVSPDDDYDTRLFEELRALRRRLADERNVPPYVVFGDVSLRHMAQVYPQRLEDFARLRGVGAIKIQEYGPQFIDVITAYVSANGVQEGLASPAAPAPASAGREARAGREERSPRSSPTYETTRALLASGLSVADIARERGLEETTVVGHLEQLAAQGVALDLSRLMPADEQLREIEQAFHTCGDAFLRPVREYLEARFTYNDLRLARLYLRQEGRIPQG